MNLNTNPHTDQELLQRIKQGDNQAFKLLFNRHYKMMIGTAVNMMKDLDAAKDLVQEVFFQLWKKKDKLEIRTNVPAYLKRAVINRALNQIKANKRFTSDESLVHHTSALPSALDQLEAQKLEEIIQATLDQLPERCRLIFVMKRMEGLSLKEIAEKLDISPKTAENQITKALKVLKEATRSFIKKT